jgi:DNA-binding MarR family transcriptional regulator
MAMTRPGYAGSAGRSGTLGHVTAPLRFDPIGEAQRQWDAHWGGEATAAVGAVTSIMRVHQILMARLNELLKPWNLTFPRYEALMLLLYSREGELPLGKIGERLQVHRASVTNVIDRLADQGLIERVPAESDRRSVLARITPMGRRAAEDATRRLNAERFGTQPLSDRRCQELFRVLEPLRRQAGDFS